MWQTNIKNSEHFINFAHELNSLISKYLLIIFQAEKTEQGIDELTKNLSQVSLRGPTALGKYYPQFPPNTNIVLYITGRRTQA